MQKTVDFLASKMQSENISPKIALILGSGLGDIADEIEGFSIPYEEIPDFPTSSVEGHAGKLVIGRYCNKDVIAMQGRFHFYEGYPMQTVIYPIRIMKLLGIEKLIVTNAAGGINENFVPGELMIIRDHINMTGTNPLIGTNNNDIGPRFTDMSEAYNNELIKLTEDTAKDLSIQVHRGVYASVSGPSYETPAEVRMFRLLGVDAVGMSTVPEVIAANHAKIKVLGISCITNMASGILKQPLNHDEVIETANRAKNDFTNLVKSVICKI